MKPQRAGFGDYVSLYNIQDNVEDGATVPDYAALFSSAGSPPGSITFRASYGFRRASAKEISG